MLITKSLKPVVLSLTSALILGTSSLAYAGTEVSETKAASEAVEQEKSDREIIVATVNNMPVTLGDVVDFHATLPPQLSQMPLQLLFDNIVDHVITIKLANQKALETGLDKQEDLIQEIEDAKARIIHQYFIEQKISEAITDEKLQEAYKKYLENNPPQKEAHASHILVKTEKEALDIITQLDDGADFAELAKEKSIDPTAVENSGDLGWFTADTMVKPFSDAAFSMDDEAVSEKPVESRFGFHVIKLHESRLTEPATLDEVKDQLKDQLSQELIEGIIMNMIDEAAIVRYDMDGNPIEATKETHEGHDHGSSESSMAK